MKFHRYQGHLIVAICDEEIIGKTLKQGNIVLDVTTSFYQGEKVDIDKVIEVVKEADIVVITGRRIVNKLAEKGLIDKNYALEVEGQLHIQIVKEVLE